MTTYRIGLGRISHEANTFSTVATGVGNFDLLGGIVTGPDVLKPSDRCHEMNGFVEVLSGDDQVELVPLLSAAAVPAGRWTEDAVEHIDGLLRQQLKGAGRLDGVCIALHGAMSGESNDDLDGFFLNTIRQAVGPNVPVVCALDFHAVVTKRMVELSTAIVAYRTHPHRDMVQTGARAAQMLMDTLRGRIKPSMRYVKMPMLATLPEEGTHSGALKDLFDAVIAFDRIDGVVACSLFPAYPWQDVPEQGWVSLAVTNDDPDLANRLARQLALQAWEARDRLIPPPMLAPADAVRAAIEVGAGPVLITDAADTLGAGAPSDNTVLFGAMLGARHQVDGLMLAHLPDAEAVAQVKSASIGDSITLRVGGKRDRRFCQPLSVTAKVICITDGPIHDQSKTGPDPTIDAGIVVCLGIDNVRLVLTEKLFHTGFGPQPSLYRKVGIEPFEARIITVKTGVGFQYTYGHAVKAVIRADCPGAISYNLDHFDFRKIPRPMFPLDADVLLWRSDES